MTLTPTPTSRRGAWGLPLAVVISLLCALVVGLWGYDRWANDVPPFRPPATVAPSPNGYDQVVAARLPEVAWDTLPRWPYGPRERLAAAVRPALPALDAIHASFRLPWQAPLPLGLLAPRQKVIRIREGGRYLVAASVLAQQEGDIGLAMQRALDAMELPARAARGRGWLAVLEAAAVHSLALRHVESLIWALPAADVPDAWERVRHSRRSWPTWTEVLEAERIYTLADATACFQMFRHATPLDSLRTAAEVTRSAIQEQEPADFLIWLQPKRQVLQRIDGYYRQMIAESKKPLQEQQPVPRPADYLSRLMLSPRSPQPPRALRRVAADLARLEKRLATRLSNLKPEVRRDPG